MKPKKSVEAHVSKTKKPMGDNYGTGIKQKVGRLRDGLDSQPVSFKKMGRPPKSLA